MRNRLSYVNEWRSIQLMEAALLNGRTVDQIKEFAKEVKNWTSFRETMEKWAQEESDSR